MAKERYSVSFFGFHGYKETTIMVEPFDIKTYKEQDQTKTIAVISSNVAKRLNMLACPSPDCVCDNRWATESNFRRGYYQVKLGHTSGKYI